MATYYATKNLRYKGRCAVIYIPKEWDIPPNKDVILLVWEGGKTIPEAPYKVKIKPRKMNSSGAIGLNFTTLAEMLPETGLISFCLITGEDEDVDA